MRSGAGNARLCRMTTSPTMGSTARETRDGLALEIVDVPGRSRFEATVDGTAVAFVEYTAQGDHVDLVHTVTEPDWGGRGIASVLVRAVLDLVRAAGRRVIPHCPFVSAYIHGHPELADLVDGQHRALVRPTAPP